VPASGQLQGRPFKYTVPALAAALVSMRRALLTILRYCNRTNRLTSLSASKWCRRFQSRSRRHTECVFHVTVHVMCMNKKYFPFAIDRNLTVYCTNLHSALEPPVTPALTLSC